MVGKNGKASMFDDSLPYLVVRVGHVLARSSPGRWRPSASASASSGS